MVRHIACYTYTPINYIHSHAPTNKTRSHVSLPCQLSHPQIAQSQTLAYSSHAQRARPPTYATPPSRLHPVFCGLVVSCIPGPISSLPAHQPVSRAEAATRLGADRGPPAAGLGSRGSSSWPGPHTRWRTRRSCCGARRLHGLCARTRGGRLHSGSTGDCPRPRPGLALRSSAWPGLTRGKGGG